MNRVNPLRLKRTFSKVKSTLERSREIKIQNNIYLHWLCLKEMWTSATVPMGNKSYFPKERETVQLT